RGARASRSGSVARPDRRQQACRETRSERDRRDDEPLAAAARPERCRCPPRLRHGHRQDRRQRHRCSCRRRLARATNGDRRDRGRGQRWCRGRGARLGSQRRRRPRLVRAALGRPHPSAPTVDAAERPCAPGRGTTRRPVVTVRVKPERDINLQGHYAGIVTRLAAFALDVAVAVTLYALAGRVIEYVMSSLKGSEVSLRDHPIISAIFLALLWLVYFAYPIAVGGRTLGMSFVGLEVVTKTGGDVDARHAVIRTIFLPLSSAFAGIGFLIILITRDRRAFHDLVAGTAVVYSWDARAARLRFLAKSRPDGLPPSGA